MVLLSHYLPIGPAHTCASTILAATMTSDLLIEIMTLHTIVSYNTIETFVIPLVAKLTSSPTVWLQEYLWNFSVLQKVHTFYLVKHENVRLRLQGFLKSLENVTIC
jgi:hypothetical protein